MKYLYIVSALLLTTGAAQAANEGTLLLQGTVAVVNDIVVTPNGANNTSLDITGGGTVLVASVAETSNNLTGYKINAKSANGSELRNTSDATKKTTYQISYDGGGLVTLTTSFQQVKNVSSLSGLETANSAVSATVAAYAAAPAGTYSDTVTFQIVANP